MAIADDLPVCECLALWESHHPECPVRRRIEKMEAKNRRLQTELADENKRLREERLAFATECVDLLSLLTRVQIHMGVKRLPNELMIDIRKRLEDE